MTEATFLAKVPTELPTKKNLYQLGLPIRYGYGDALGRPGPAPAACNQRTGPICCIASVGWRGDHNPIGTKQRQLTKTPSTVHLETHGFRGYHRWISVAGYRYLLVTGLVTSLANGCFRGNLVGNHPLETAPLAVTAGVTSWRYSRLCCQPACQPRLGNQQVNSRFRVYRHVYLHLLCHDS